MSDGRDALPAAAPPGKKGQALPARTELLCLALLTVMALALRLWRLESVPGGPHVDEAWNWIDARRVLDGWRPLFLPDNAGREVLYTYLQAALLGLFGDGLAVARAASALAATAMVPLAWAVGRALAPRDLPRGWVGLPCAALAAGSYWSLHFGRFGIRAITFPLFVGGVALLWLRAVASQDRRWAIGCGILLGLALYSHPAGRGLIALPLAHVAWLTWRAWRARRGGDGAQVTGKSGLDSAAQPSLSAPWRTLGITAFVAVLVAAPVIGWWLAHPGFFLGHAGEVSVLGSGPGAVWANLGKVVGMFNLAGDPARWRNLPGRPVFDPLTGLLFWAGIALALRAALRGEPGPALALAWLLVLLAPTVLADQAPNFSRAIGILPVIFVFPALALGWLAGRILGSAAGGGEGGLEDRPEDGNRDRATGAGRPRWATLAAIALVAVVPLQAGESSVRDYFLRWAVHPETPIAFDDDLAYVGRLAGDRWSHGGTAYVSPLLAAHPTIRVSSPVYVPGIDTQRGIALLESEEEGIALGLHLALDRLDPEQEFLSGLEHGWPWRAGTGEALKIVDVAPLRPGLRSKHVRLDLTRLAPPASPGRFGPLELIHADARFTDLVDPYSLSVTLGWRATAPPERSLTLTIRVVDSEGRTLAQRDGLPLGPGHETDRWRGGEVVLLKELLPFEPGLIPENGPHDVLVGWYELDPSGASDGGPQITDLRTADDRTLIRAATTDYPFQPSP